MIDWRTAALLSIEPFQVSLWRGGRDQVWVLNNVWYFRTDLPQVKLMPTGTARHGLILRLMFLAAAQDRAGTGREPNFQPPFERISDPQIPLTRLFFQFSLRPSTHLIARLLPRPEPCSKKLLHITRQSDENRC